MNKVGCLIIHGFGGNIGEINYLAEYLETKNYYVKCPVLKGHTNRKKDLIGVNYIDWIKSAQKDLDILMNETEDVIIVGFSMGGLVGINLCKTYNIKGLVTLNTPIYYWDVRNIFMNIINDIKTRSYKNIKRYFLSSKKFPFTALYNFRKLLSITKPKLKNILCPVLIIQSNDDDTVKKISAQYIYDKIGSDQKEIKFYNNGGHVILRSLSARQVSEDIERFIININNRY